MMTTPIETVWSDLGDTLKRFIVRRVSDEQVADDILQDVFVKIHNGIADLNDERRIQAWVYQIARNAIIDHYRRSRSFAELPDDLSGSAE